MTERIAEYPADRAINQLEETIRLIMVLGSITHEEIERATEGKPCGKITTIRSQVSDLRMDCGWPIKTEMESHGNGRHARYSFDFEKAAALSGVSVSGLKLGVQEANSKGFRYHHFHEFIEFTKAVRAKDERISWALMRDQMKKKKPAQMDFGESL